MNKIKLLDNIKCIISNKVILVHPNFSKDFDICINASDVQLEAIMS